MKFRGITCYLPATHINQCPLIAMQRGELGLFNATKNKADMDKFKTPILRNSALTALIYAHLKAEEEADLLSPKRFDMPSLGVTNMTRSHPLGESLIHTI